MTVLQLAIISQTDIYDSKLQDIVNNVKLTNLKTLIDRGENLDLQNKVCNYFC